MAQKNISINKFLDPKHFLLLFHSHAIGRLAIAARMRKIICVGRADSKPTQYLSQAI